MEKGAAYYCFCEKAESEEDSGDFDRADDPCRNLSAGGSGQANLAAGKPYVIRQRIPHEGTTTFHDVSFGDITVENKTLDDQVLLKRDGLPTYNFANVVDDHLMGITHVVRGSEYLSSAPKYNLLYEAFGWEVPTYVHCSPVMRDQHNKMSKRHGDPSYEDLKAQGLPDGRHFELCGPAGLGAQGRIRRAGDLFSGRAGEGVRHRRYLQVPRHLRHREADLFQRHLSPGHGRLPPLPRLRSPTSVRR